MNHVSSEVVEAAGVLSRWLELQDAGVTIIGIGDVMHERQKANVLLRRAIRETHATFTTWASEQISEEQIDSIIAQVTK